MAERETNRNGWRRRDFLKLLGGGVAGIAVSPMPWKLLDDAAIWTQNWSWLPRLPRGEITTHRGRCTLCSVGCGLRADCVNGEPFRLTGLPRDPLGGGRLCPLGIAGHQLRYHPARLRSPEESSSWAREAGRDPGCRPLDLDAAVARLAQWIEELRGAGASQAIGILDTRPGRLLSEIYRRFAARLGAQYLQAPGGEWWSLPTTGTGAEALPRCGIDLSAVRTLLSFGAPILDEQGGEGGGTRFAAPAGVTQEAALAAEPLLIQVETRPSTTARRAGLWLRIAPGSECALALGLAHVLVHEDLYDRTGLAGSLLAGEEDTHARGARAGEADSATGWAGLDGYRALLAEYPPERAAAVTGIPQATIRDVARRLAAAGPAVAIPGRDPGGGPLDRPAQQAVWNLNLLTGALARARGLLCRASLPLPERLADAPAAAISNLDDAPDGSLRLLLIDAARPEQDLPWESIARKLAARDARIVSLSPYRLGLARHAALRIPAPAPLEGWEEVPSGGNDPRDALAIARPLVQAPQSALHPSALLERTAELLGLPSPGSGVDYPTLLRERAALILRSARGQVHRGSDGRRVPLRDYQATGAFWEELTCGGCWIDDGEASRQSLTALHEAMVTNEPRDLWNRGGEAAPSVAGYPLTLMPFGRRGLAGGEALPPVMAKLYRESRLRCSAQEVQVHPETARRAGVADQQVAWVETPAGRGRFRVQTDPSVHPTALHVATGPSSGSFGDPAAEEVPTISALAPPSDEGIWRMTPARLRPAES